jgi:hypothetical protein
MIFAKASEFFCKFSKELTAPYKRPLTPKDIPREDESICGMMDTFLNKLSIEFDMPAAAF